MKNSESPYVVSYKLWGAGAWTGWPPFIPEISGPFRRFPVLSGGLGKNVRAARAIGGQSSKRPTSKIQRNSKQQTSNANLPNQSSALGVVRAALAGGQDAENASVQSLGHQGPLASISLY